jgi:hypothetical protein
VYTEEVLKEKRTLGWDYEEGAFDADSGGVAGAGAGSGAVRSEEAQAAHLRDFAGRFLERFKVVEDVRQHVKLVDVYNAMYAKCKQRIKDGAPERSQLERDIVTLIREHQPGHQVRVEPQQDWGSERPPASSPARPTCS